MDSEDDHVLLAIRGPRVWKSNLSGAKTVDVVIEGDTSRVQKALNRTRDAVGKLGASQRRIARAEAEYANACNKAENKRRAHWRKHAGRPKSRRR